MKKILNFLCIAGLMMSVAACSPAKEMTEPTPATAVEGFIDSMIELDIEAAGEFTVDKDAVFSGAQEAIDEQRELFEALFSEVKYTIGEVTENGDEAMAAVTITNINVEEVMAAVQEKAMEFMLEDPNYMELTDIETEVELVKEGDDWLINNAEDLLESIIGDM